MKTLALAAVGMTIALGGAAESMAADRHLDNLAFQLRNETATLVREIKYGYRRHPEFAHLYEDAVEMARHADLVHEIAHHRLPISRLAAEVSALDELFHHVEEVVEDANATHLYHINGFHQRRACAVMAQIEQTLHHLLDDVTPVTPAPAVIPAPAVQPVLPTPTIYGPGRVIYPPGYEVRGYNRGGFTYRSNNGRFQITVGR